MKIIQPTYVTSLPSTGVEVKFRPYMVKEEKVLLLAIEEGDSKTIIKTMKELIIACTSEQINPDKITYFDLEFLFLQIRSKSVGEVIDLVGGCECSKTAKTPFTAHIEDAKINNLQDLSVIKIPDSDYIVKMNYPTIENMVSITEITDDEDFFKILASCVALIANEEEEFIKTESELVEFFDSLSPKQQSAFTKFFNTMPSLVLPAKYTCNACGKHHEVNVAGIENFFG